MANPINPYVAGNPVGDSPAFIGRADVLREVLRVLRRPQDNAIVLYGQRRIGKTSILQHLKAQLLQASPYRPVYFDLQDKAAWPLGQVLRDLARTIAHTLGQPDPDLGADPETAFRQEWLPATLNTLASTSSLTLLLDEFDVLSDAKAEQAAAAFFPYLRDLMASNPQRLKFVFVIGRNVNDLTNIALSLFKGIPAQRVSLLSQADTADLARLSQKNGTLNWPDDAVERVWSLSHGHPFLTHQLCSHVWERIYDDRPSSLPTVNPARVDVIIPAAMEASDNLMEWLWDGLPPAERVVASALAEAGPGPTSWEELEQLLRESGVRVIIRELQNTPQLLQDWDFIEPADGGYCFRVEFLRRWIAEYKPLRHAQAELDRIEPIAESLYQAALGLYQSGRLDPATSLLRQAINLNLNHASANQQLADILLFQGKVDEAQQLLERLYEYQPTAAHYRLVQALLMSAQSIENDDQQLILYERILKLDPAQPEAIAGQQRIWKRRGDAFFASSDLEAALDAYERADLADDVAKVQQELERKIRLANLYQQALEALQRGDRRTSQTLLAQVIAIEPEYEQAARYLYLTITGVDVAQLQAQIEVMARHIEALVSQHEVVITVPNPFFYGRPVPPDLLLNRRRELRRIIGRIINQGQSTAIVGDPHSGKTSLLLHLAAPQNRKTLYGADRERLLFSFLDAETFSSQLNPVQFWEYALRPLHEQVTVSQPDSSLAQTYQVCRENGFGAFVLERLLAQMETQGWRLVLLLDEFDLLLHHPVLSSAEFFGSLRSLASRSRGALALVMTSRYSLTQLNEATQQFSRGGSPYFNFLDEITLGPLPDKSIEELSHWAEDRFTPDDRRFIVKVAGGHPYLSQMAACELWEGYREDEGDAERLRHRVGHILLDDATPAIGDIWQFWHSTTRMAFTVVALAHISSLVSQSSIAASTKRVPTRTELVNLFDLLIKHFNEEDLRTLCFCLQIEYADLPAEGRKNKARELIEHLERHNRIHELMETGRRLRRDVPWENALDETGAFPFMIPSVLPKQSLMRDLGSELLSLAKRGFVIEDTDTSLGWQVRPCVFLWWLADTLVRTVHREKRFEEWLQQQGWDELLTHDEKQGLEKASHATADLLNGSVSTLIQVAAKGK